MSTFTFDDSWCSHISFCQIADAKHTPQGAIGSDIAGVRNATSGSLTDKLTREHRMTLDEAHLILNLKQGETLENVLKVNSHRCVNFFFSLHVILTAMLEL